MNIAVDGNNSYHTGWLACFLGLPRRHPGMEEREILLASEGAWTRGFLEGWDTCNETPVEWRCKALPEMVRSGQALVYWVDDENLELEAGT